MVKTLWQHKFFILFFSLLVTLVGTVTIYSIWNEPDYQSQSQLHIESQTVNLTQIDYKKVFSTSDFYHRLIIENNLKQSEQSLRETITISELNSNDNLTITTQTSQANHSSQLANQVAKEAQKKLKTMGISDVSIEEAKTAQTVRSKLVNYALIVCFCVGFVTACLLTLLTRNIKKSALQPEMIEKRLVCQF